jgi:hypothetical protein
MVRATFSARVDLPVPGNPLKMITRGCTPSSPTPARYLPNAVKRASFAAWEVPGGNGLLKHELTLLAEPASDKNVRAAVGHTLNRTVGLSLAHRSRS